MTLDEMNAEIVRLRPAALKVVRAHAGMTGKALAEALDACPEMHAYRAAVNRAEAEHRYQESNLAYRKGQKL